MKNVICGSVFTALFVFLSYTGASGQIVDKAKDIADKAKDVTVETATKTKVIVTDGLATAANKTKSAAKVGASTTKKFGNNAVNVTENVTGDAYEGGKYYMVKTWDGTKWVAKRVWYKTKDIAGKIN